MTPKTFADKPNQKKRIAKLREELEKLGGSCGKIKDMPADVEEEFLRHVLEYETAQPITLYCLLENAGLDMQPAADLDDVSLRTKLQEIIEQMSSLGAYLLHTNHLSDRELYVHLYEDSLREEAVLFPENSSYAYMIDLTGSGSDEDNRIYLEYYANEEQRKQWANDWPDDPMPQHNEAAFDRDRNMPPSDRAVLAGTVRTTLPRNPAAQTSRETRTTFSYGPRSRKTGSRATHFRRTARLSCNRPPHVHAARSGFFPGRLSLSKQISCRRERPL